MSRPSSNGALPPKTCLDLTTADFEQSGADLLGRWRPYFDWTALRSAENVLPYSKASSGRIHSSVDAILSNGTRCAGINFASQDYLNLSAHPAVHDAALKAIRTYGVHSAGSAALMGNTQLSLELEQRLAGFLGYRDCTIFPTGWGAGYGAIRTLVRPGDHIVIDVLAHACLHEGARNATGNVSTFPHCSNAAVRRRLERIRADHPEAGILVVTEGVFSMDSDVPDIAELQDICRAFGAFLLVDVAHDLGALGPTGRGVLELQDMVGKVDIVMGSFSKTFASNGGFVATNEPALKPALRYSAGPLLFSNALSPVQAAIVLAALDIVESEDGRQRRDQLMANVTTLRDGLVAEGFAILGQPSAIVPVLMRVQMHMRMRVLQHNRIRD